MTFAREEHAGVSSRDHLYYFGYKMRRENPFRFPVTPDDLWSAGPNLVARKSYAVDLTNGSNRSQPPLARHTSKPCREEKRIPVKKRERERQREQATAR